MDQKDNFNFEWLPGFREMMVCQNEGMAEDSNQENTMPDSIAKSNNQSSNSNSNFNSNSSDAMPDNSDSGSTGNNNTGNNNNDNNNTNTTNSHNNISHNNIWQETLIQNNGNQMLPPEQLQQEEQQYWKDYEYLIQMLPLIAREVWIVADALLDQYEYTGSSIYSEYPDKVTILKIVDMVYDKLKYREEQEMMQADDEEMVRNPYFVEASLRDANTPFRTLIQAIVHWNINHRRQRYYRRQKVFSKSFT